MSLRDDQASLRHMLDHAREAVQFAHGKSEADLQGDRLLDLALVRLIEVVGEAAARVSPSFREKHPEIPWQDTIL